MMSALDNIIISYIVYMYNKIVFEFETKNVKENWIKMKIKIHEQTHSDIAISYRYLPYNIMIGI